MVFILVVMLQVKTAVMMRKIGPPHGGERMDRCKTLVLSYLHGWYFYRQVLAISGSLALKSQAGTP